MNENLDLTNRVAAALNAALEEAGTPTPPHLQGIVNSRGDTMDDVEVLEMLEAWKRS